MTENLVNFDVATHDSDKIKELITKIKSDFIYLGLLLKEFKEAEEYKNLNYASFESYVENELHFNKSTAYNLIAVQERFGDGMNINKKYVDYSYSQLTELVNYSDEELNIFPSSLSVRAIKDIKSADKISKRLEKGVIKHSKEELNSVKFTTCFDDDEKISHQIHYIIDNYFLNLLDLDCDYEIKLFKR